MPSNKKVNLSDFKKWQLRHPLRIAFYILHFTFHIQHSTQAQIPLRTWQTHSSYENIVVAEKVGSQIYAASANGFFYVGTNLPVRLSKQDGLAETGARALAYAAAAQMLVVGYESGNIDLIQLNDQNQPQAVQNLPLIKNAEQILGSKRINQVVVKDNNAYLATDFGIVLLDLTRNEIRETYQNIGANGAAVRVTRLAFANDSLYAQTSAGLLGARFAATINLQFFGNWRNIRLTAALNALFAAYEQTQTTLKNQLQTLKPNGPRADVSPTLYAYPQTVAAAGNDGSYAVYQNQQWRNTNTPTNRPSVKAFAVHPTTKRLHLLAEGLLAESATGVLETPIPTVMGASDLAFDSEANVWITASSFESNAVGLQVLRTNGQRQSFPLPRRQFNQVLIDDNGYKWLIISGNEGGGILVFDEKMNRNRILSITQGAGALPSTTVNALSLDRDGAIWVATDRGVAVFDNPAAVFNNSPFNAYLPVFDRRRLLASDDVTDIATDGGNFKWMATRNNGLFRFSTDGTELAERFTAENSPLPSNQISSVVIEPTTGEVFVATSKGIVSFGGTATAPEDKLTKVRIFPNPVRPEFNGTVGINGLTENAVVKITDLAGRLVYETRSQGGTASWNLLDYQSRRSETGVYLVLMSTPDGQETLVGKLAIVQ